MEPKGPLSLEEQKFIETHCILPDWTDKKISEELKRDIATISKHRKKIGLHKGNGGKPKFDKLEHGKASINTKNKTDEEKMAAWKAYFRTTPRYERLAKELTEENLKEFLDLWADYARQFEDLTPSEEEILEVMITYKTRISDNRRSYKQCELEENQLRQKMGGKDIAELDLEHEEDRFLFQLAESNNRMKIEINKDFRELTKIYEGYFRSMNSTREQREQNTKVGGDTFLTMVRDFNNIDRRKEAGRFNERFKIAKVKQEEKLKKPHKFVTGEELPIMLDGADSIKGKIDDSEIK